MFAKIAQCMKINKTKSTRRRNELQAALDNDTHISTKATPAGTSWIYVFPFCYHSLRFSMLQSELSSNAQRFNKMHICTEHSFLVFVFVLPLPALEKQKQKKARTILHVQKFRLVFNVSRTKLKESQKHLGGVQRYAADNVQCATCIKRNITIIMMPFPFALPSILYHLFGYFTFETLLWAIARFLLFP